MARIFEEGFLAAYQKYADDGFVPEVFNTWSALSIIAGALERKVWLPWSNTYSFYPNIYVLLVTKPGTGKSVSSGRAVDLLQEVSNKTGRLNLLPNQVTESMCVQLMGNGRGFTYKNLDVRQNAGYYYASEGSNSLKDIYGEFIAALTEFYDCPTRCARGTKKDGITELINVCMNVLGCCTFDYLDKLVSDENIGGGFASRLIYVCYEDMKVREQEFQGGLDDADRAENAKYRSALIQDLTAISEMVGPFQASAEVGEAWKSWYMEHKASLNAHASEKVQSIMSRTNTNVLKVAMLLSAAESDKRCITIEHWKQALALVTERQRDTPRIFREIRSRSTSRSPTTLTNSLITILVKSPGISLTKAMAKAVMYGHNQRAIEKTMAALLTTGVVSEIGGVSKFLGNPDDYL